MRYSIVTETYPPEVNGVALTVQSKQRGLRARGHADPVSSSASRMVSMRRTLADHARPLVWPVRSGTGAAAGPGPGADATIPA